MLKLYGFRVSNYFDMVKFALLEKGLEFEEVHTMPNQEEAYKIKSPMGKVPFIETEQGCLSETSAILDYIEAIHPNPPLMPSDLYAAAKVREVMKVIELYIELQARRHFPQIFFGGERNEEAVAAAKPVLENGVKALNSLACFDPFICGEFSNADIMATYSFIYAAPVCRTVYDWDIIADVPGLQAIIDATNARPVGVKVAAEHDVALKAFQAAQD